MKFKSILMMAFATLVMTNCSQDEYQEEILQGGITEFTADVEGQSRSTITDGGTFSWATGDKISIWNGSNFKEFTYTTGNTFTGDPITPSKYAVYPAGNHKISNNALTVNLPISYGNTSTDYVTNTNAIMVASVNGSNLTFKHVGGLMRFNVKNVPAGANQFVFTASDKDITGDFKVNGETIIAESKSSKNTVTIHFKSSNSTRNMTFYIPLPTGKYNGFKIEIKGNSANLSYESTAKNTVNRRSLLLMPAFECNNGELDKVGSTSVDFSNNSGTTTTIATESVEIKTSTATNNNSSVTLNYTPSSNSTLSLSDDNKGCTSGASKATVNIQVPANSTVSAFTVDAPSSTVELSTQSGSATYETVTAKTAANTLKIKKGITVNRLILNGGHIVIENGAKVDRIENANGYNEKTYIVKKGTITNSPSLSNVIIVNDENDIKQDYVLRVLTFEDGSEKFEPYDCNFFYAMNYTEETKWIEKWSDYIPTDGQYGNGHGAYEWYDEGNTELAFVKPEIESWWGISGHAGISNYVGTDDDINLFGDDNMLFMIDLQAYNVKGGANGSKNFCSQYGYLDPEEYATQYSPTGVLPGIQFYDEVPRVIDHMYVTNTTYAYGIIVRGECDFGGSYEYTDESTFKIVAYGYDSFEDTEPTTTEFYLLNTGKRIVTDWTKWDLSVLGKVVRVEFNLVACYEGYGTYGLVIPAYFAYDDVAVQFTE